MKILFTISSLDSGGAERVLTTLANKLSCNNEIIIIKYDNGKPFYGLDNKIVLKSINMRKISKTIFGKLFNNIKIINIFRNNIKYYNLDIVISFMDRVNIYTILATSF